MQATPPSNKSGTKTTNKSQTLQTSELNRDSWADEIEGKINLFDKPLGEFFKQFVPSPSPFLGKRPWSHPTDVFRAAPITTKEADTYKHTVSIFGLSHAGTHLIQPS